MSFPALPPRPAYSPSPRALVTRGRGATARPFAADWTAAGKPATLLLAIAGPGTAALAGYTFAAPSGRCVVVGATGLAESGGRIRGRLVTGTAPLPLRNPALEWGRWYPRDEFLSAEAGMTGAKPATIPTISLIMASPSGQVETTYRASGGAPLPNTDNDDTLLGWTAERIEGAEYDRGPVRSVKRTWPLPFPGDRAVQFLFRYDLLHQLAIILAVRDSLLLAARAAALGIVDPATATMPWIPAALALSRSGQWVQRASAGDRSRRYRHDAGAGDAPAVLVVESATLERRPVTSADFGQPDYNATDWRLVEAGQVLELDLTDAQFAATVPSAAEWMVLADVAPVDPEPTDPTDPGPVTPTTPPGSGEIEELNGNLAAPVATSYVLVQSAAYASSLVSLTIRLAAGAGTARLLREGAVIATAALSTTEVVVPLSTGLEVGHTLTLDLTTLTGASGLAFTLASRRA